MKAIKQVDVVISTVGQMQLVDQVNIIAAIKQAGNIKVISLSTIVWAIHHTKKDHLFPTPVNKRHVLTSLRFKKL